MTLKRLSLICVSVALCLWGSNASAMASFSSAKNVLPKIYAQIDEELGETNTIYCGCRITYPENAKWTINLKECGYKVRKQAERAKRIEVEHVMPAWEFGHQLKCWQQGGRKNCGKDDNFNQMEGDLHNLYPSVGEVNSDRGNFQFSDWNAKPSVYGKCEMVIDFKGKRAQPPKASRGQIARAYLYMSQQYDIKLSNAQRRLYEAWNRMYPPTKQECMRNELIKEKQGNLNKFISEKCK